MEENEEKEILLEIEALSVERSGRQGVRGIGLRNVSLKLRQGEVAILAGENGCGSSLLGKLILGVSKPGTRVMSGSIQFSGEDLLKTRRSQRRRWRREDISFLPRKVEEQFNPNLTVRQCLRETAKLMGRNKSALPESEWSDQFYRVGIVEPERLLARRVGDLATLTIRKLGVMRALVTRSRLLICDHATERLDRVAAFQFLELIRQIVNESGLTVMIMTGNLRSAEAIADQVSVFYEGGILESGKAEDVVKNPSHRYTREFLNCLPDLSSYPRELETISRDAIREAEATIHGREAAEASIHAAD